MREITDVDELKSVLTTGEPLRGIRLQGVDLHPVMHELLDRTDVAGLAVLGGNIPMPLDVHFRTYGAVVFPDHPDAPVDTYRNRLYTPDELYAGLATTGYASTPDALAYDWLQDGQIAHDALVTMLRAIHDDAISDALRDVVIGLPSVGVMGGHAMRRGTDAYAGAARAGASLAHAGFLVLTGGGPGAMEAANLGALVAAHVGSAGQPVSTVEDVLGEALAALAAVPSYTPSIDAWAKLAMDVRRTVLAVGTPSPQPLSPVELDRPLSIGIPTWYYGHEPPNVFCDVIAKYFSNAVREDELLVASRDAVVVLPGAAGTVQEIFQVVTRLYYADEAGESSLPQLVLVDRAHWTEHLPVWPLLTSLARGRVMAKTIHLVDSIDDATALVESSAESRRSA